MTGTLTDDLEKKARQAAQIAIVEARQATQLKHYGLIVKKLPVQIRQHGLGQMLVFLQARGKDRASSPHAVLANQIQRHLADVLRIGSFDVQALTSHDSRFYLRATQQAELFLNELVLFVEKFA
jgi:CRISPR/Cas system CMR-associated protein Cmr5 small subunit